MPKPFKVKRYRHIYRRHTTGGLLLRFFGVLFAVGILGFIGWNAYGPMIDYFSGNGTPSSSPATPDQEENALPSTPEATPSPAPANLPGEVRAVYIPFRILSDSALLEARLDELAQADLNAVLFDLKDTSGRISYQSRLGSAQEAGAVLEGAVDLTVLCDTLKSRGLTPIGRLNAYMDPLAPTKISGAGVKYVDSDILWLDNSPENGGKAWLNPYSTIAQAYISDLATEAVSAGVMWIVLDQVTFPTGFSQEYASYGSEASSATRAEVLSNLVDIVEKQVTDLGGKCSLYISGTAALGAHDTYYGGNPFSLSNGSIVLGAMPAQFGDEFIQDDFILERPVMDPYGAVNALLQAVSGDLVGKDVCVLLQGYNAAGTVNNNKAYNASEIDEQVRALTDNGIGNYIVYSPDGSYPGDWP